MISPQPNFSVPSSLLNNWHSDIILRSNCWDVIVPQLKTHLYLPNGQIDGNVDGYVLNHEMEDFLEVGMLFVQHIQKYKLKLAGFQSRTTHHKTKCCMCKVQNVGKWHYLGVINRVGSW
jgi:hypothetical protein